MTAVPTTLRNRRGERLDHVFTPGREGGRELVIVAHGVTSSHDRPYLVALCDALASAGLASLRFSFAGNGRSEGRFEDCTISKEVEDLGSILDALDARESWTVGYAGHSMGSAVGVLRAAADERLRALISLAGMARVQGFVERHFGGLAAGDPMLGRERCPLSQAFLDDARAIDTVLPQAAAVGAPWMLVHGTADELVPFRDALDTREASGDRAELVPLEGADHRFDGGLPQLLETVVPWLARTLAGYDV